MEISRVNILEDLKHILVDELFVEIPKEEIDEKDQLFTGIGLDSIGFIEMVTIIEDKYKVKIENEENLPENSNTLGSFADYILDKIKV